MPAPKKAETLIPLQDLDLQIHRLRVQRSEKPRLLASFEDKLAHSRSNLDGLHEEIKGFKLECAKRELSVKEFDDRITKLQTQAMQARKNDEYQAFMKEISGIKADRGRVEDGLLDIYMQVDEKAKLEKVRQEEVRQAETDLDACRKRVEGEMVDLDRQIAELASRRAAQVESVDKEVLRVYDRVLEAKDDGLALAAVGKYDVVEDTGKVSYWQCEGCSVSLTSQDVNELMRGKDVIFCRTCSRILYLRPA